MEIKVVYREGGKLAMSADCSASDLIGMTKKLINTIYSRLPMEQALYFRESICQDIVKNDGFCWGTQFFDAYVWERAQGSLKINVGDVDNED